MLRALHTYRGKVVGLKFALAPFACRTAEEQRIFYEIFDNFWKACEEEAAIEQADFEKNPPPQELEPIEIDRESPTKDLTTLEKLSNSEKTNRASKMRVALYISVGLLLMGLIYEAWPPPKVVIEKMTERGFVSPHPEHLYFFREGETPDFKNSSTSLDTSLFEWQIVDRKSGQLDWHDRSFPLRWKASGIGSDKWIILRVNHPRYGLLADTVLVHIRCNNPPIIHWNQLSVSLLQVGKLYEFSVETEADCAVSWQIVDFMNNLDTILSGPKIHWKPVYDGSIQVQVSAVRLRFSNATDCSGVLNKTFLVGANKPYLARLTLQEDEVRPYFQLSWLAWSFAFLLLAVSIFFFEKYRRQFKDISLFALICFQAVFVICLFFPYALIIACLFFIWWSWPRSPRSTPAATDLAKNELPITDSAPYDIPYLPQEGKISVPRTFFRLADVLRQREQSNKRQFDPVATVQAMAASGGFPRWRERADMRPTEYLFLVERPFVGHQQGHLFERLTDFLRYRDVLLLTFFHDGNFDFFWNDDFREGLTRSDLYREWPNHRLVLLGHAHGLVAERSSQPALRAKPLADLLRWPRRLLLTPESVSAPPLDLPGYFLPRVLTEQSKLIAGWSFREALLHQYFWLYPADTAGLLAGFEKLDLMDEHEPSDFEKWQAELAQQRTPEDYRYRRWDTPDDHRDYLRDDPDVYRWLRALSTCLQPNWALTIAIGDAIGVEPTHDRLLRLTRIPWLRDNEANEDLRQAFLTELIHEDDLAHDAARRAVATELDAVRDATENGFAEIERRGTLAVHRFVLDPREPQQHDIILNLKQQGLLANGHVRELNLLVKEKFDRTGMPDSAFESLDTFLNTPLPRSFWNWDFADGLFSLACFACLVWIFLNGNDLLRQSPAENLQSGIWLESQFSEADTLAVRLNNQAIKLAQQLELVSNYEEYLAVSDTTKLIDSLFQRAIMLRNYNYPLADSNQALAHFNSTAKLFRFYLNGQNSLSLAAIGNNFSKTAAASPRGSPLRLAALHGQGLYLYYTYAKAQSQERSTSALDSALTLYQRIITESRGQYFDSLQLRMPVNLESLLKTIGKISPDKNCLVRANFQFNPRGNGEFIFKNLSKNAVRFEWQFSDGQSSTVQNPVHRFATQGEPRAILIAIGTNGCSDTMAQILPTRRSGF